MLLSAVSSRRCRIVKLVRALRKGWIKTTAERRAVQQEPEAYLLWEDDGLISSKTPHGELLPLSERFDVSSFGLHTAETVCPSTLPCIIRVCS